jgi:transposase InsO family protein
LAGGQSNTRIVQAELDVKSWIARLPTAEDGRLAVLMHGAHERSRQTYGSPRLHAELQANAVFVSRKRVIRIMQGEGIRRRVRRRYRGTTMSDYDQPVAANILDRKFDPAAPNKSWVGDVTELITQDGRLYLAVVLDLFSRFVVGWALSAVNDRHLAIRALDMALRHRCPEAGLLHHTDQGSPYASDEYQKVLDGAVITCSMSRRGNCYDNAVMESFFSGLKLELGERFDAKDKLFDHIEVFYNQQRRHSAIGYASPAEFEKAERLRFGGVVRLSTEPDQAQPPPSTTQLGPPTSSRGSHGSRSCAPRFGGSRRQASPRASFSSCEAVPRRFTSLRPGASVLPCSNALSRPGVGAAPSSLTGHGRARPPERRATARGSAYHLRKARERRTSKSGPNSLSRVPMERIEGRGPPAEESAVEVLHEFGH